MKIALIGAHRVENFGDLLLASIFRDWLRELDGSLSLTLPFARADIAESLGFPPPRGYMDIRDANGVLFIGGGYLSDSQNASFAHHVLRAFRYGLPGRAASIMNKPLAFIGVGIGPLAHGMVRRLMRQVLDSASLIAPRDVESVQYLEELGVKIPNVQLTADAALSLQLSDLPSFPGDVIDLPPPFERSAKTLIGVHISNPASESRIYEMLHGEVISLVQRNARYHAYLLVDQAENRSQMKSVEELSVVLRNQSTIVPYLPPSSFSSVLSDMDVVVTDKLHVGIVARAMGTPSLSIAKHSKTPRLYKQIGAPEDSIPLDDFRPGDLTRGISRLLSHGRYELPKHIRQLADRNRTAVAQFLAFVSSRNSKV